LNYLSDPQKKQLDTLHQLNLKIKRAKNSKFRLIKDILIYSFLFSLFPLFIAVNYQLVVKKAEKKLIEAKKIESVSERLQIINLEKFDDCVNAIINNSPYPTSTNYSEISIKGIEACKNEFGITNPNNILFLNDYITAKIRDDSSFNEQIDQSKKANEEIIKLTKSQYSNKINFVFITYCLFPMFVYMYSLLKLREMVIERKGKEKNNKKDRYTELASYLEEYNNILAEVDFPALEKSIGLKLLHETLPKVTIKDPPVTHPEYINFRSEYCKYEQIRATVFKEKQVTSYQIDHTI
jgi:hypothetical protein